MNGHMRDNSLLKLVLATMALLCAAAANAGEVPVIEPRDDFSFTGSSINGDYLMIGDVARVRGGSGQWPAKLTKRIQSIELVPAPYPGTAASISRGMLQNRLRLAGVDLEQVEIRFPAVMRFRIPEKEVSEGELAALITGAINERFSGLPGKLKIELLGLPRKVSLPAQEPKFHVDTDNVKLGLRSMVGVEVMVQNTVVRKVQCRVRVSLLGKVLVAVRDLSRHDVITPADVAVQEAEVTGDGEVFTSASDVVGLRLCRSVRAGNTIPGRYVEKIPLITRGDRVRLEFRRGPVVITSAARALDSGGLEDTVRVRNLTTRKEVYGVVKNRKCVIVAPMKEGAM